MPAITAPQAFNEQLFEDMFQYETISYVGRLDLADREGLVAIFKRRQQIRFLQSDVPVFLDRIWGDGIVFRDYWTDGLDILDVIRTAWGRVAILRLPRTYSKGETFEVRTERRILGGFTKPIEYWESMMFSPTKWLKLEISGATAKRFELASLPSPRRGGVDIDRAGDALNLVIREPQSHLPYRVEWAW